MTLEKESADQVSLTPGDQRLLREHEGGIRGVVGKLGKEASAKEGGEQGGDHDVDEGEHDARGAVRHRVATSVPNGLGGLKGKEDRSHEAVHPGVAHLLLVVVGVDSLVILLESVEGGAGDDEVGGEDGRPHEDEAEPAHLEDLVHTCVATHCIDDTDVEDEEDAEEDDAEEEDAEDEEDTYERSGKGPSTCAGRTHSAHHSS